MCFLETVSAKEKQKKVIYFPRKEKITEFLTRDFVVQKSQPYHQSYGNKGTLLKWFILKPYKLALPLISVCDAYLLKKKYNCPSYKFISSQCGNYNKRLPISLTIIFTICNMQDFEERLFEWSRFLKAAQGGCVRVFLFQ